MKLLSTFVTACLLAATAGAQELWVDPAGGSDTNPGTATQPLKTLTQAIVLAGPWSGLEWEARRVERARQIWKGLPASSPASDAMAYLLDDKQNGISYFLMSSMLCIFSAFAMSYYYVIII